MKRYGDLVGLLSFALILGCVSRPFIYDAQPGTANPTRHYTVPFDPHAYDSFKGTGTGTIDGQAFATTNGGSVKYAAGDTIRLIPVSAYTTEWWNVMVKGGEGMDAPDSRMFAYVRNATADAEGHFHFEGIPAGKYYVYTHFNWMTGAYQWSFVRLGAEVTISQASHIKRLILQPMSGGNT